MENYSKHDWQNHSDFRFVSSFAQESAPATKNNRQYGL
jgi:hypothetical protein